MRWSIEKVFESYASKTRPKQDTRMTLWLVEISMPRETLLFNGYAEMHRNTEGVVILRELNVAQDRKGLPDRDTRGENELWMYRNRPEEGCHFDLYVRAVDELQAMVLAREVMQTLFGEQMIVPCEDGASK